MTRWNELRWGCQILAMLNTRKQLQQILARVNIASNNQQQNETVVVTTKAHIRSPKIASNVCNEQQQRIKKTTIKL